MIEADRINLKLTPREIKALEMASHGWGNKDIALAFGIGRETVADIMSRIFLKMRVSSRVEAVCVAIRSGVI